jgi:Family of unknown function (DUF6221)
MTLDAFLTARLDDDQAWADGVIERQAELGWTSEDDAWDERGAMGIAEWSAMRAAKRVLREVAAKRAILAIHEPVPFWGNNPPPPSQQTTDNIKAWYCECQAQDGVIEGEWPCETVRALAAVYSDHPDYDNEWKVQDGETIPR